MSMIRFTANHSDLSTDKGFQFKFYCDKCRNGYMSRFQPSWPGTAGSFLRAAGDIFGGVFHQVANSAYEVQRAIGGSAHDTAFEAAVKEAQQHFKQCQRCGKWVCPELCWSCEAGLCKGCAPKYDEEREAAIAQGKAYQLHYKGRYEAELVKKNELLTPTPVANCLHCGAKNRGGKFCTECGKPLQVAITCPGCNAQSKVQVKFCPQCGTKIPQASP